MTCFDFRFNARYEYRKENRREIIEMDKHVFKPCDVKMIMERRIFGGSAYYFVHYDGKKWDVMMLKPNPKFGAKIKRWFVNDQIG